jgi:hypothetical protein
VLAVLAYLLIGAVCAGLVIRKTGGWLGSDDEPLAFAIVVFWPVALVGCPMVWGFTRVVRLIAGGRRL